MMISPGGFFIFLYFHFSGCYGGKRGKKWHFFDISEYQSFFFFDPTNKRVIGKMENEFKGIQLINLLD